MSIDRKTRSTAARAIAAFLEAQVAAATLTSQLPAEWSGVTIQLLEGAIETDDAGELVLPAQFENLAFPAVIVGSTRGREHDMGGGYLVLDVTVMTVTQLDEAAAPRKHDARVGFVSSCFLDQYDAGNPEAESLDLVRDALNLPASGPDTRKVTGFHCYGIGGIDEEGRETQRRVMDTIKLELHCQAVDGA